MNKLRLSIYLFSIIALLLIILILLSALNSEDKIVTPEQNNTSITESSISSLSPEAKIIFVSNRDTNSRRTEIYSMDLSGDNVQRITTSNVHHFIMGVDNSRRFIVTSVAEKNTQNPAGLGDEDRRSIHFIDLKEKTDKRLTDPENHAEGNSFSPDSEWIVFMMTLKGDNQGDIYKMKIDGTALTQLTKTEDAIEGDPEFSPDGKSIVFTYYDDNIKRSVLKIMDSEGQNIQTLYYAPEGIAIGPFPPGALDPSWSNDGEWIVFEMALEKEGNFGSGQWHLFKIRKDGTNLTDLSLAGNHSDRAEYLPSFSYNDQLILFGSIHEATPLEESHSDIFVMDSNGTSLRRLTFSPSSDLYPAWID